MKKIAAIGPLNWRKPQIIMVCGVTMPDLKGKFAAMPIISDAFTAEAFLNLRQYQLHGAN